MSELPEPTRRPLWRRLLRWCGWSITGVFALCLLLIAALVLINWHDEPLTPEAQAWLVVPENPVPDAENAWLAMQAAVFEVPLEQGVVIARNRLEFLQRNPLADMDDVPALRGVPRTVWQVRFDWCRFDKDASLASGLMAREDELLAWLQPLRPLLARYYAATTMPGYHQLVSGSPMEPFGESWELACLAEVDLSLRLMRGDRSADTQLVQHLRYGLNGLTQSRTLISSLLAAANVRANNAMLIQLDAAGALTPALRAAVLQELQAQAAEPVAAVRQRILQGELRFSQAMGDLLLQQQRQNLWEEPSAVETAFWWGASRMRLFQPNASLNFHHQSMLRALQGEVMPCPTWGWHNAYNPVGKHLCAAYPANWESHFQRLDAAAAGLEATIKTLQAH